MARRMFSPEIVESDAFLEMPASSQALYFHLGMYADDDGFVSPNKIMRMMNAGADDLKVIIAKRFVLPFENGVVVIKHWKINNLIRKDWYRPTQYLEQKNMLSTKENGSYTEKDKHDEQLQIENEVVNSSLTKLTHRLGKDSIGKDNNTAKNTATQDVVNYFFELKGWGNKDKDFYSKNKIIYSRYVRPAKDLLELCEQDIASAKECLDKISSWAKSRELDWSIETVFKKWYELDFLKPKETKPHFDGCRIFRKTEGGKWWIIRNGEIKELGRPLKQEEITWK